MSSISHEYFGALIICQADYKECNGLAPLKGVLEETKRLKRILKKDCRFDDVKVVSDLPNKAAFDKVQQELAKEFGGKGKALWLVYYAGHGFSWQGQMFYVPVDGRADDPSSWVNVNKFMMPIHDMAGGRGMLMKATAAARGTEPSPGSVLLLVFSCCRQRPEEGTGALKFLTCCQKKPEDEPRLTEAKYGKVTTKVIFMHPCDDGKKALDDGVFGKAFCDLLATPGLRWFEFLKRLHERMEEGHQRLWVNECAGEYEFVLHPQRRGVNLSQAGGAQSAPPQTRFAWLISQRRSLKEKYGCDSEYYVEEFRDRLQVGGYMAMPHRDVRCFDGLRRQVEEVAHNASVCVLYFTGLATMNSSGQTILLPDDSKDRKKGILLDELIGPLQESGALVYVILDLCREGSRCACPPAENLHENVCVFYACDDDLYDFQPGLFTKALTQALEVGEPFSHTWIACEQICCKLSDQRQRPWDWTLEPTHFRTVLLKSPDDFAFPRRKSSLQHEAGEISDDSSGENGLEDDTSSESGSEDDSSSEILPAPGSAVLEVLHRTLRPISERMDCRLTFC